MRVAFIPSTFLPWVGGAEIQTHNIANKIVELGHKVDIFLLDEPRISNNNYKIILLNKLLINIVFILKYYLNLEIFSFLKFYFRRVCENKKYDVWHFHSVNYKTLIYIKILKELNQKVFITFQGADIQKDHEIKYGYRFDQKYESFLMEVLKSTNGVFAISENIINDLKFFSYPPEKITKIPNSVEIKKIKNVQKKKTDNQILKIITVARFYEKKKGLDILEKVAKLLIDNNFKFTWTLVGRNSNFLLKSNFVKKNINYFNINEEIGNKDEIYFPNTKLIELYNMHDVYVNLARIESFGITMIEAIAAGLPVISFNTKGANEIVINNKNGFLINEYNPVKMANFLMVEYKNIFNEVYLNEETITKYDLGLNAQQTIDSYKK